MMRKSVYGLLVAILVLPLLGWVTNVQAQGGTAWVGEYFDNMTLTGDPMVVRVDQDINFQWDATQLAPGGRYERFSVRWTTARQFEAGTYRFSARSDDGIRVSLDNEIIIDAWYDKAPDPAIEVDVNVTAGSHALLVEYYNNTGPGLVSLTWSLITPGSTAIWIAEYYNNLDLIGPPTAERIENVIDHYWDESSPLPGTILADNFSARWTGSPYFSAGTYTFTLNADDGVRLWVDSNLLIDQWVGSGFTPPYTVTVTLAEGQHAVRVEYFELLEVAAIRLTWTRSGTTIVPTPAPPPVTTGAWQAQYFNNTSLADSAVHTEQFTREELNLNWGTGSPDPVVAADNFSGRLTRTLPFNAGALRFVLRADDGVRLYVDGQMIANEWHVASGGYYFVDYPMTAGNHTLTVEFYEGVIRASLRLYWVYTTPSAPGGAVTAQVNAFLLNVRNGPGPTFPVIDRIARNQIYAITGRSDTDPVWWRINARGIQGWVKGDWVVVQGDETLIPLISAQEAAAPGPNFGAATGLLVRANLALNIRSGPSINFPAIGALASGQSVDVVGRNADTTWWEINFSGGRGWVSAGTTYTTREGVLNANVPVTG